MTIFRRLFSRSATKNFHTIVSKETIKPSSPTPSHLKYYNLSLLDQFDTISRVPVILFYPNVNGSNTPSRISNLKLLLQNSLSQTLSLYYPLAGRFTDGSYVDCDDYGVEFSQLNFNFALSKILENKEYKALDPLSPTSFTDKDEHKGFSPLIVQLSSFECGGVALSVCISHKIGDGCSMFNFLTDWASIARSNLSWKRKNSVQFIGTPMEQTPSDEKVSVPDVTFEENNCVTKKFVFGNSKIAKLKDIASESGFVENPTRVQVLTALLYERVMAADKANSGLFKPSALIQPVNLRSRVIPKLPLDSFGNFCLGNILMTLSENEANFNALAVAIKKGEMQFKGMNVPNVNEWFHAMRTPMLDGMKQLYAKNSNLNLYYSSSFLRYPVYEVDFGLGKPVKVTLGGALPKNTMVYFDTPNLDGVEATVTLEEEEMTLFEADNKILEFAS